MTLKLQPLPPPEPPENGSHLLSSVVYKDGRWLPSKPLPGPFVTEARSRIKGAWLVLTGRATAVRWY